MKKIVCIVVFIFSAISFTSANADTLLIDSASQKPALERPTKGQSKATVESKFGTPINKTSAVGEPPISSWVYSDFTVYFEYDLVLHSVLIRQ